MLISEVKKFSETSKSLKLLNHCQLPKSIYHLKCT